MTAAFALMCLPSQQQTTPGKYRYIYLFIIFQLHLCVCYWQNVLQAFVVVENKGLPAPDQQHLKISHSDGDK